MSRNKIIIGENDGLSNFIYETNEGKKYYFVPPGSLTQTLQMYFSGVIGQIGLGIDSQVLLDKIKEIEQKVMSIEPNNIKDKQTEIIKITTTIEQRVSQLIPVDLMIKAAMMVVFEEGETFELNTSRLKAKIDSISGDSDAKTFFYLFALVTLMNYKELSSSSAADYLKAVQMEELMIENS